MAKRKSKKAKRMTSKGQNYQALALKLYNEKYNQAGANNNSYALGDILESGVAAVDNLFGDTKVGNIIEEAVGTAGNVAQGIVAPTPDAWAGAAADFSGLTADVANVAGGKNYQRDEMGQIMMDPEGNPIVKTNKFENVARNIEAGAESAQGFLSGNIRKGVQSGLDFVGQTTENIYDFEREKENTGFQSGLETVQQMVNTGFNVADSYKAAQSNIESLQAQANQNEADLNVEGQSLKRGSNVQDRINRMRSYMGGHKVMPQRYDNGSKISTQDMKLYNDKDLIITDNMLVDMISEWEKGTQTSIHPSNLPRTQVEFNALDQFTKKLIGVHYPDLKYNILSDDAKGASPNLGGQAMVPFPNPTYTRNVPPQSRTQLEYLLSPVEFENLVNMQSTPSNVVNQKFGSPRKSMNKGSKVKSYDNGDKIDPTNPVYTNPTSMLNVGNLPDGNSPISSIWNPRINMGYASNLGDDASDLAKLGNMQAGLKLALGDRTNIGTTFGYRQPLGTTGPLRNTIASADVGMGLRPGVTSFYDDQSRQAEAYGDLNLGLGRYGNFKGGLPWGVKGSLNLGSEHSMQPGVSGQLDANLGLLRAFGGYGTQSGGYGGLGVSLPLGGRERRVIRKHGTKVPKTYEMGSDVEVDPTLQGINSEDLTTINRESGEVVRRMYPNTKDTDVENYYEYKGDSHSNVRSGMPNGGNDVKEQVGAFIFPKKYAKNIKKIVRDRQYYQNIINNTSV